MIILKYYHKADGPEAIQEISCNKCRKRLVLIRNGKRKLTTLNFTRFVKELNQNPNIVFIRE